MTSQVCRHTSFTAVGNPSYGLAVWECEQDVDFQDPANRILGNGFGLPPEIAAQMTTHPKGVPVPELPDIDISVPSIGVD